MKFVGRSFPREDSVFKVDGRAVYTGDIRVDPLLHGVLVRSPYHHALIQRIVSSDAMSAPGVKCIVTSDDIPGSKIFGPMVRDKPVLANTKVRHLGEPVALVIADDFQQAVLAAKQVVVEYEELHSVHDVQEALDAESTPIHQGGNLLAEFRFGDPSSREIIKHAPIQLSSTFYVPRIAPAYLEVETVLASWLSGEGLRVWTGTQAPFQDRSDISRMLALEEGQIEVIVPEVGGSFGGKQDASLTLIAALGAWVTRSNLRIQNTRKNSMLAHPKRHPVHFRYEVGADSDGTLLAMSIEAVLDTGAYASYGPVVAGIIAEVAQGPYRIPHVFIHSRAAYTNGPPCGAVRGVGGPQAAFACESMMDMLATNLGMDPIELRRKNALRPGDRTHVGVTLDESTTILECLNAADEARAELSALGDTPGMHVGIGVASSFLKTGIGNLKDVSNTHIDWMPGGEVCVRLSSPDFGQGLRSIARQIVAEELDIDLSRIRVGEISTRPNPDSGPTVTSRTTFLLGNSLRQAAKSAIEAIRMYAAQILGIGLDEIEYRSGSFYGVESMIWDGTSVEEIANRATEEDRLLRGEGEAAFPVPDDLPSGLPEGYPHYRFCYGANVARVLVDPSTGVIQVTDVVAIHDVGKAINPANVEGQIEGGVVMGLGYALLEEMKLKPDGNWTDNFAEYLIPTAVDAPKIKAVILENPEIEAPYGARGIGEPSAVAAAAAIANAIFDATRIRVSTLPVHPEDLI